MPSPFEAPTVKTSQFQGVVGDHATVTFRQGDHFHGVKDERIELRLNAVSCLPAVPASGVDERELANWVQTLRDRRLLVIVRSASATQAARDALYALLARACAENTQATRFTHLDSDPLPLHGFLRNDSWTHTLRGSIIYLDRSQVVDTLADEFVQNLTERLRKADAQLILVTTRAAAQAAHADLAAHSVRPPASVPTWQIGCDDDRVDENQLQASLNDPIGLPVLACACFLPGLGLEEFVALVNVLVNVLVNALAPETTVAAGSPPPAAEAQNVHPSPGVMKWRSGAHDELMSANGVGYIQPATPIEGALQARGCHLIDQHILPVAVARLLSDRPAFLHRMRAAVLSRYFASNASARFQSHALRFLMLLHANGIHRFQAPWLRDRFTQAFAEPDEGESLHRLLRIVPPLLEEEDGPTLVKEACEALAQHGLETEGAWHRLLQQTATRTELIAALQGSRADGSPGSDEAEDIALASSLIRATHLGERFDAVVSQTESLLLCFLYLASHEGSREAAAQGLLTLMTGPGEREGQRALHEASPTAGTLLTPVLWLLPLSLVNVLEHAPGNWTAFAQAACAVLQGAGSREALHPIDADAEADAFSGSPSRRRQAATVQLAHACVQGFEALVSRSVSNGFAEAEKDALTSPDTLSTNADALATLMSGRSRAPLARDERAGRPTVELLTSIEAAGRLLEALCRASIEGAAKTADAGPHSAAARYIACYRERLTRMEHRTLLEWARERTELYREWSEYHLAVRDRAAAKQASARLRASNLLSRSLHTRLAAIHDTERLA